MAESNLSAERVRELFDYDQETGILTRKPCPGTHWRAFPITRSRDVRGRGYLKARVDKRDYFVHRLVWLYVYGEWPKLHIDHIDRNPGNNRIENLRDVTQAVNQRNRRKKPCKPKPVRVRRDRPKSVGWVESTISQRNPYRARAWKDGKKIGLGMFPNSEAAWAAVAAHEQSTGQLSAHI